MLISQSLLPIMGVDVRRRGSSGRAAADRLHGVRRTRSPDSHSECAACHGGAGRRRAGADHRRALRSGGCARKQQRKRRCAGARHCPRRTCLRAHTRRLAVRRRPARRTSASSSRAGGRPGPCCPMVPSSVITLDRRNGPTIPSIRHHAASAFVRGRMRLARNRAGRSFLVAFADL